MKGLVPRRGALLCRCCALLLAVAAAMTVPCAPAAAEVRTTSAPAGDAETVYVAGNPDWYPVEYFDPETKTYEGVLPEVLDMVSESTGIDFTYVHAGDADQRERLAENGQVDMVSGCRVNEAWLEEGVRQGALAGKSRVLITIQTEEGDASACVAYTSVADEQRVRDIETALQNMDGSVLAGASVTYILEHPAELNDWFVLIAGGVVTLLVVVMLVQQVRLRRYRHVCAMDTNLDSLTSIWNKEYLIEYYRDHMTEKDRALYCMVYFGFDIVRVNRYYGEDAAEEQLCFAAQELRACMRDGEVAARVSGGGLAALHKTGDVAEAVAWAEQALKQLNRYTDRYGRDYRPVFRAGVYMLHYADDDCEAVLRNARQGYLQAALDGVPSFVVGRKQLRVEAERLELKKQAYDALRRQEFKMFLQFVVDSSDGHICGAEAVSRWDHPRRGLLYPGSYIDILESEGTVAELDYFIFEEACRQLERWHDEGRPITISCNFSRITICRGDFVQRVEEICDRYVFDHASLVMEITEAVMESNREAAFANVSRCKEMGFRIALDDTGDGNTSFSDLRDYPIDVVKVDRSILNAAVTSRGAALLRGVIALVHSLDMKALGEGAETREQVELLREMGCDYIQGYYFYRPLPLSEALRVLDAKEPAGPRE